MQKLVFRNGAGNEIDLTAGNFGITNWAGLSNTPLNIQTQQVPFEDGGVFLDALMEQREIDVTVAINDNNNLELRYQLKRELISALNPKLGEGVLIYTNDYLSRQIHAVPQIPLFENKNSNDKGTLKASVTFSCPSPYWEDVEETVVEINSVGTNIENNGDVSTQVKIEFQGSGTNNENQISNPYIFNGRTAQEIRLNGTFKTNVFINTEVGKKEVYTKEITESDIIFGVDNLTRCYVTKSEFYNAYFKVDDIFHDGDYYIQRSSDCVTWETIRITENSYSKIIAIGNIILLYEEQSEIFTITQNFVNWYDIPCDAINKIVVAPSNTNNSYTIYLTTGAIGENLHYCRCQFEDGIANVSDWTLINTEGQGVNNILYNPYLDKVVLILNRDSQLGTRCLIGDFYNGFRFAGTCNYVTTEITYIKTTHKMVKYGTQYGYIEESVNGITWTPLPRITNYVNVMDISYIEKELLYVAVGYTEASYPNIKPHLLLSVDMQNWEDIPITFAKDNVGIFEHIVYNENRKTYFISGNFQNNNDDFVILFETDLKIKRNQINRLTDTSDLKFQLINGINNIFFGGCHKCFVTYRKKYIGV